MKSCQRNQGFNVPKGPKTHTHTQTHLHEQPWTSKHLVRIGIFEPPNISSECFFFFFFPGFPFKKTPPNTRHGGFGWRNLQCKIQTSPALNEPFVMLCKLSGAARYLGRAPGGSRTFQKHGDDVVEIHGGLCTNH